MRKPVLITLLLGVMVGLALLSYRGLTSTASATAPPPDGEIIASMLNSAKTADIGSLPSLPAASYTLPAAGVDVMRVRMEETYTIDGVGTDTVQLTGWIAARHDTPRAALGYTKVEWGTAIIDTEFVGLELTGESKIFGPIHVSLDADQQARGQVGAIEVPELKGKNAPSTARTSSSAPAASTAKCLANIPVKVRMPQLNLNMKTDKPVRMYSLVETIPPVGHTASISLTPTALISESRTVGTLERAEVKFREIVMQAPLHGAKQLAQR